MKKQAGLGLVELVLTLVISVGIFALSLPFWISHQKDQEAQAYADHLRGVITRVHQYEYYKITVEGVGPAMSQSWPEELINLMTDYPERFWNTCSILQEQNHECVRPDFVPWSNSRLVSFTGHRGIKNIFNSHFIIRVPLSELEGDATEFYRWANPILAIPGAQRVGNDIEITLRQATLALMYDNIVMKQRLCQTHR